MSPGAVRIANRLLLVVLVAAGCFIGAKLSYAFTIRPSNVVALWAPSGLMLALLVVRSRRDWPVLLAGGFIGNLAADLHHGLAPMKSVAGSLANSLEVLVASAVVVRLVREPIRLASLRQVGALVIGAAVVANACTALVGAAVLSGPFAPGFWRGWFVWWAGDGIGMLIVAPALLTWLVFIRQRPRVHWRPVLEAGLLATAFAGVAQFVMSQERDLSRTAHAEPYMVFPLLFWAVLRFGPVGGSSATLGVAAATLWNAAQGRGPFAQAGYTATNEVLQTYAFLTLTALSSMIVSSVMEERKAAEADANDRSWHATLTAAVATAVTERASLADVLKRCAEALAETLEGFRVCIWTVSPSEPVLELQACGGVSESVKGYERIPIGEDFIVADVARTGRTCVVNGEGLHGALARHGMTDAGLVQFCGLPLLVHDRTLGVIGLAGHRPLSGRTVATLESAARTIALGIERRRLEETRSRLVGILEATPDFVTIGQIEGPPVFVNAAARRALGIAEGEPIDSLLRFRDPAFREQLHDIIVPQAIREGTWRGETQYLSLAGRAIPVSQVTTAHRDSAGDLFLSTISRDITDRLAEQQRLRDAEARLRFALEASGLGVWEVNLKTGAAYWSETCEVMHGLEAGSFDGTMKAFIECIHPEDRAAVQEAMDTAVRDHREPALVYRVLWPNGQVRQISSTGRFIYDETRTPIRGAGIAMDITERRSLEAQLQQAQKMEAIGQLAGGIAHDFNNLITAIIGFSGLLAESLDPSDTRRADVDEIERAARRAADLTRQLLAFSRKQILQPRVLRLGQVVGDLMPMLRRLLGETIELKVVIADRGFVKADVGQLEQVLVNVAVNARDAMPSGGCLTIETGDAGAARAGVTTEARVFVSVTDTGHGMDQPTQQRIFEPFFTTKPQGRGTGLGLATVHGIVTQSGGTIEVSSEIGRGTTFIVYLPATLEPAEPPAEDDLRSAPAGAETILLVEDEQVVRDFVARILSRTGYETHVFDDPRQAISFAQADEACIDLVLTDVVLPGMDGRTMVTEIVKAHPEAAVLYMSGYADSAIVDAGVLQPDTAFVQKPFAAGTILRKVRETLDHASGSSRSIEARVSRQVTDWNPAPGGRRG